MSANAKELTAEQKTIIDSDLYAGTALLVNATAGSGKTFTVSELCRAHVDERILYLAFNRSLMVSARAMFRDYAHIRVETFHSLALTSLSQTDPLFEMHEIVENYTVYDVLDRCPGIPWKTAAGALQTLERFFAFPDETICARHTVGVARGADPNACLHKARELWAKIRNDEFPISHDAYLKIWWLSKPTIDADVIVVDEFQDLTELQFDLVLRQKSAYVFLGDPHQSLYGFRHAVPDPIGLLRDRAVPTTTLHLNRTFRFGPKLAALSTLFLRAFKDPTAFVESSNHDPTATRVRSPLHWSKALPNTAVIFRSNRGLVRTLLEAADTPTVPPLYIMNQTFVPETERAIYRDLVAIRAGTPEACVDPALRRLRDLDEADMFFRVTRDYKMMFRLELLQERGHAALDKAWSRLTECVCEEPDDAALIFTTIHGAKGLEFEHVILGDDFPPLAPIDTLPKWKRKSAIEAVNLVYVAITRAVKSIFLNDDLYFFAKDAMKPSA